MTAQAKWHFNKEEQRKLKRERLLRVAAECFNEKGFSGTSLKDVATRLGITDAALYYYVRNKEELVNLCYIKAADLAEDALNRAEEKGENAARIVELYVTFQVAHYTGAEAPIVVMSELAALDPEHREPLMARSRTHNKRIASLIEKGVNEGAFKAENPVIASNVLLGALSWVPKWYHPDRNFDRKEVSDGAVNFIMRGFAFDSIASERGL